MNSKFIKSGEKKRLLKELDFQFGIKKLPYLLIETGKQKIRGFSGTITREEIDELAEIANVEIIGLYLFKKENGGLRLGLDGSGVLGAKVEKNEIEISDDELNSWFHGKNLDKEIKNGIYLIKFGDDYLGCGISDGKKVINFVPKERRIRN
jgi:NOL1/NOP2/fmu family ribosome biogenesis protein